MATGVFLLRKRILGALKVGDRGQYYWEKWFVAVYAPSDQTERCSFFSHLRPFLVDLAHLVLMGDWNVILNHTLDRGRGASGSLRDGRQVDLIEEFWPRR